MSAVERAVAAAERTAADLTARTAALIGRRVVANAENLVAARDRGLTLAAAAVALIVAPLAFGERVPLTTWARDYALPLDTSLRWAAGQVPHLDYAIPVGAAYWLAQGLAVELTGLDAISPVVANLIVAAVLAPLAWLLLAPRLTGGLVGLVLLATTAMIVSPRALGDPISLVSFLGAYNKYGLAILAVLLAAMFVARPAAPTRAQWTRDAAVIAALMVWLVYLKVTFAAIALAGGVVALHYAPGNRRAVVAGIAGAAALVLAIGAATGINGPYLDDLARAAGAAEALRAKKLFEDLAGAPVTLLAFALALVFTWRLAAAARPAKVSETVVALGLFAAGVLAMNQVHDHALPLAFAALVVLAHRAQGLGARAHLPATIAAAALVGIATVNDLGSAARYHVLQDSPLAVDYCEAADAPACGLAHFFPGDAAGKLSALPAPRLGGGAPLPETGIARAGASELDRACNSVAICVYWQSHAQLFTLLNAILEPDDRPYQLGFTSLLAYYWQLTPPRGVPAWIDLARTFAKGTPPDAEALFADVTVLVVSRNNFTSDRVSGPAGLYDADIARLFDELVETDFWAIWRRRPSP